MAIYNQSWLFTIVANLYDSENPHLINQCEWQTLANIYGVKVSTNSWVQDICKKIQVEHIDGNSYEQSLAQHFGATKPINGSWIQALANNINS